MIIQPLEAIREALEEIEKLGYVIIPGNDGVNVEIVWPRENEPPNIDTCLQIIETDPETVGKVLQRYRCVSVPVWLLLGYPWDRPLSSWKKLQESSQWCPCGGCLDSKKENYITACIEFYKNNKSRTWKYICWKEPWPVQL